MNKLLKINTFIILFVYSFSFSQINVPYRLGDKFGISDEKGKMIIPVQFDNVEVGYNNDFTGIKGNKISYILNNKIILKDTDFTYFDNEGDFIIGVLVKNRESFMFSNGNPNYLTQFLYDKNGEQLLKKSYNNIIVIDRREREKEKPALKETALLLLHSDNRYGLYQFHKKQKKIIKTFFENANDVDPDYNAFPNSFSIVYDENRTKKKLVINFENGNIKSEKTEELHLDTNSSYNDYGSSYEMPPPPPAIGASVQEGIKRPPVPENAIDKIAYADSHHRYIEPEKPEQLTITKKETSFDYAYLKKENNKTGYFLTKENQWLVTPKYDEIILADGHGVFQSGFVLRNGNDYQFLVTSNKVQEFITPEFKMFPLFFRRDYNRKGFHLFKMFDKDNNFFCYANQNGKLYYSK